jgi:formamidopyrimidine-DNA glycosylase
VVSHGKVIILQFEGGVFLLSHLGMGGRWRTSPDNNTHLWLEFERTTVYYDDPRHMGSLTALESLPDFERHVSSFGYDLLKIALSPEYQELAAVHPLDGYRQHWHRVMSNSRQMIAKLLVDQKRFAGLGNYLRADTLYLARVIPSATSSHLTYETRDRLFLAALAVIRLAYKQGGLPGYPIEGVQGTYESPVYRREFDNEGRLVMKYVVNSQTVYWVPSVQVLSC